MNTKKHITILGVLIIILWFSYIHILIPAPFPLSKTVTVLEGNVLKEIQRYWFIGLLSIILGVLSGILIVLRKKYGRIFAIGFSLVALMVRVWKIVTSENVFRTLYFLYVIFLKKHPFLVIQNDIIAPIIFIVTIVYLTRPQVKEQFK